MAQEISPKETTRAAAYELWMNAPNPMVTFFKTIDVTKIVRVSKKKNLKFNMLLDYGECKYECLGMTNDEMKAYCEKLFPTLKLWKQ